MALLLCILHTSPWASLCFPVPQGGFRFFKPQRKSNHTPLWYLLTFKNINFIFSWNCLWWDHFKNYTCCSKYRIILCVLKRNMYFIDTCWREVFYNLLTVKTEKKFSCLSVYVTAICRMSQQCLLGAMFSYWVTSCHTSDTDTAFTVALGCACASRSVTSTLSQVLSALVLCGRAERPGLGLGPGGSDCGRVCPGCRGQAWACPHNAAESQIHLKSFRLGHYRQKRLLPL